MADIEQTIYKLELDGSAYIAGADKVSASTAKLSDAQEKANAKFAELQKTSDNYKETIIDLTGSIKANEKEINGLNTAIKSMGTATKDGRQQVSNLRKEIDDLRKGNLAYNEQLVTVKKNLADTNSQLKLHTKEVQAAEKATGNFTGGLTKAYSGLRSIANLIPGIGLSGLVLLVAGPLVNAFTEWFNSMTKASAAMRLLKANQENLNEVVANADKAASKQITDLKILYQTATDVNLSIEERRKAVKALQLEFPDYFKNISAETILNGQAADKYNELAAAILATARATAAKAKIDEIEAKQLDLDFERQKVLIATANELAVARKAEATAITSAGGGIAGTGGTSIAISKEENRRLKEEAIRGRRDKRLTEINENKKDLTAQEEFLIKFAGLANIAKTIEDADGKKFKAKAEKKTKEIENIYEIELQKLKADIAKLDEKGFTDEATITKAVEEDFKKRTLAFDKAFKNKQLTAGQLTSLKGYLADLQKLTLDQNLKSFREQKAAYLNQIQSEIDSLQIEENTKRISTIQDRFERERQMIIAETEKTANTLKDRREKQIADITKNAAKNGLTPADVAPQIKSIKDTYGKLLDDLEIIKLQKLQQLSFDTFEKLSEDAKRLLDSGNLGVSEGSLIHIQKQTQLFLSGKISYEKYQKELTEIARFETNERFRLEKLFLEAEIRVRQDKLKTDATLTDEQITRLEDEIRRLQQQLTDAEKGNATSNASTGNAVANKRIDTILKYTQAIGDLASKVISFWQQVNAAETASLDRSIAIQEKRVSAAQRIAERGNAQYLKQEQDRLTELNVKRENAARKQLGINAALQGSEILVALISGLAQGAKIGGGLGAIASVAAIVAAIAGAFAIAQSLKPPTPSFFVGTEDTGKGGKADSKGGFHAVLHPHERVLTAEENKKLKGLSNRELVETVNRFHQIKSVPLPNYDRIKNAAELSIGSDGRMSVLLEENNNLQRQTLRVLHKMGVNVSLDQHGFAVTQMEVIEQMKINKRI